MESFEDFKLVSQNIQGKVLEEFKDDYSLITNWFDKIFFLINRYGLRYYMGIGSNRHSDIVLSTLYKGMENLASVIELTVSGNVGSARIIIRNIFEFLVMGKYMLLYDDQNIREKWDNVEYINIDRGIFNRTIYPNNSNKSAFVNWWAVLCQYSHATRALGQVSHDYNEIKTDIRLNFTYILMIFIMLCTFMNQFLATPYFKNYIKDLARANPKQEHLVNTVKFQEFLSKSIKIVKSTLTKECKQIINYYAAAWRVEQNIPNHSSKTMKTQSIVKTCEKPRENRRIVSKPELLSYIKQFINIYTDKQKGLNDVYRNIVLKYLKLLEKMVHIYSLNDLDNGYFYDIDINNNAIQLILCKTSVNFNEEDENCCFSKVLVLIEVKSEFLSLGQYAKLYNYSIRTVQNWIKNIKLHGAQQINGDWFIPEMHPVPTKGFYHIQYLWKGLSDIIEEKYPFLVDESGLRIIKSGPDKYECWTTNKGHIIDLDEMQRVAIETDLLSFADIIEDMGPILVP